MAAFAKAEKVHIVLVGNPGTGKSTILNSLCRETLFKAGVSYGRGLTSCLQEHEMADCVFADTPGLADITLREQAAREIESLFRSVKRLKIVFVITLEAGRARPQDLSTICLVLDALNLADMTNRFAILINKCSKRIINDMKNPDEIAKLIGCLNGVNTGRGYETQFIRLIQKREDLEDQDNVLMDPPAEVLELLSCLPYVDVVGAAVRSIETENFAENNARFESIITQVMAANQDQLMRMQQEQAAAAERMLEVTRENNRLQMEQLRQEAEAQAALAAARREAEIERIQREHDQQTAQLAAQAERQRYEAELQRHQQNLEMVRAQQAQQEAFLNRQNEAMRNQQPAAAGPGPLEAVLGVVGKILPFFL